MLMIPRKADESGALGSSFSVGPFNVTVMRLYARDVKIAIDDGSGKKLEHHVPYDQNFSVGNEITLHLRRTGCRQFGCDRVRVSIDAPKRIDIRRDDVVCERSAA